MYGCSTRRTSLGWKVIRVHYSADEDKDPRNPVGAAWLAKAKKGFSSAQFAKEFDIDYGALSGTLVFPEFDESIHIVDMFDFYPEDWTVWLACDPHPRTSHAFVWLGVNKAGEKVVGYSWWPDAPDEGCPRLTIKGYVESLEIIHSSPMGLKPRYKVMDVAGKAFNADEEHNYFDAYRNAGIHFQPAKKNREWAGYDLINEALRPKPYLVGNKEVLQPTLRIMGDRGHNSELAYRLKTLRFREFRGNVQDKNAPEDPIEKDRHLVDCLSYILLASPRFVPRRAPDTYDPIYPNLGR